MQAFATTKRATKKKTVAVHDHPQAATKIREELDIPVVYLTAFADDESVLRSEMLHDFAN